MILLARHGETDDNREPLRFQGQLDTPLNDTGRAQARELAQRVAGDGLASLHCSSLSRARETAEIVGARIGRKPIPDPRFDEGWRGDWEGRLCEDVEAQEPEAFAAWRRAGEGWRFPGGESLAEQRDRVLAGLADVRAHSPLPALVVCHGGCIRVVLCERSGRGLDAFHEWEVPNVAVVEA